MTRYEVQAVIERTYGVVVVEADDEQLARELALANVDKMNTAVDSTVDIISVDETDAPADVTGDDEQAERNARTDLCDECKPVDHPTCSMDPNCSCCRTTIAQMEDDQ